MSEVRHKSERFELDRELHEKRRKDHILQSHISTHDGNMKKQCLILFFNLSQNVWVCSVFSLKSIKITVGDFCLSA